MSARGPERAAFEKWISEGDGGAASLGDAWACRRRCLGAWVKSPDGRWQKLACDGETVEYERQGVRYFTGLCQHCSDAETRMRCEARRAAGEPCYCKDCKRD